MTYLTEHIEMTERKEGAGWYTAMYFFLEHMRLLSDGAINHKVLFARLSEKGNLINHDNPRIRRSVASSLSRTIHSIHYTAVLESAYQEAPSLFDDVAEWLYSALSPMHPGDGVLVATVLKVVWADMLIGFGNERLGGRAVDIVRISNEMELVRSWAEMACLDDKGRFSLIVSAILRIAAFGHLDESKAHRFAGETLVDGEPSYRGRVGVATACVIRLSGETGRVSGVWALDPSRTYAVGRYSDCDIFDPDPHVSRKHCVLLCQDGSWHAKNESKSHGVRVLAVADGKEVQSVAPSNSDKLVKIRPGRVLELSSSSRYLFLGMDTFYFGTIGHGE